MNKTPWYTSKEALIGYHILAWLVWFSFPFLIHISTLEQHRMKPSPEMWEAMSKLNGNKMPFQHKPPSDNALLRMSFIQNIFLLLLFYANAFVFVPRLLLKKKVWQYMLLMFGLLLLFMGGVYLMHRVYTGHHRFPFFGPTSSAGFYFLFIIALSLTYRTIIDKVKNDQLQKERENANLQTELAFLRSQISPHFMFNVLNNMVSMARKKSDELEPSLIKLSGLMRYMLYEANANKVPLEKELEYLHSYIDLQQQRFGNSVEVGLDINIENPHYHIEPMLLIPFVENAFKHGVGFVADPSIKILVFEKEGRLIMDVSNRFNILSTEIKDKTSGIGLSNAKRRLDLLYSTNHELLVTSNEGWFNIQLQIKLT